jgi:ElaB/YqjD/DUF883 family membrane-anchored ribosome-binding protein
MTKDEELAILDATILKFGTNSYLGPWLMSMRQGIEKDMRDDVEPTNTLIWYRNHCQAMLTAAKEYAESVGEQARQTADKIIKDAQKQAQNTKSNAAYHLRKALEEVA